MPRPGKESRRGCMSRRGTTSSSVATNQTSAYWGISCLGWFFGRYPLVVDLSSRSLVVGRCLGVVIEGEGERRNGTLLCHSGGEMKRMNAKKKKQRRRWLLPACEGVCRPWRESVCEDWARVVDLQGEREDEDLTVVGRVSDERRKDDKGEGVVRACV